MKQQIPHAAVAPKQIKEKCEWGPNCPICKNIEEDWDGDLQGQQQQKAQCPQQNILCTQSQGTQQPLQRNFQCSSGPKPPVATRHTAFPSHKASSTPSHKTSSTPSHNPLIYQIDMQSRSVKEESGKRNMERLNDKYGLDYYSSSKSESDREEEP